MEALDSALTAFYILLWLPGCLVVVFSLDLVCQSAILGFVVYVKDLLKLPFVFDVAVIVPFGDSARDLAAFPGVDLGLARDFFGVLESNFRRVE